jgi:hypothetical protein
MSNIPEQTKLSIPITYTAVNNKYVLHKNGTNFALTIDQIAPLPQLLATIVEQHENKTK